jgi:hypothetical protein
VLENYAPTIPDWANDQHTPAGRKLGRGLDHFRKEGAKLAPPPTRDDPYEDEAYRLWTIKQEQVRSGRRKASRKTITSAGGSGCMSKRTSIMLKEVIKLHRFAGISPEKSLTEAGRLREAMVAADQSMVIGCFGDDLAGLVDDDFHALPPVQRPLGAAAMLRN